MKPAKIIQTVFAALLVLGFVSFSGRVNPRIDKPAISPSPGATSPTIFLPEFTVITETPVPSPTIRPSPTPTITPTLIPFASLDELFEKYSRSQSFSKATLRKIAVCESGFNSNASNGIYGGLFQFSSVSWRNTRIKMNQDPDPQLRFNPEEAIKTAAFKMATQGVSAWPNCGH